MKRCRKKVSGDFYATPKYVASAGDPLKLHRIIEM